MSSVSDAARLTHIRQDIGILDLEKDDYSNFPSLAYARGFLLIYARLLEVDVTQSVVRLENSNPVDIAEYEYLSGKAPAPLTRVRLARGAGCWAVMFGGNRLHHCRGNHIHGIHVLNTISTRGDSDFAGGPARLPQSTPVPTAAFPSHAGARRTRASGAPSRWQERRRSMPLPSPRRSRDK